MAINHVKKSSKIYLNFDRDVWLPTFAVSSSFLLFKTINLSFSTEIFLTSQINAPRILCFPAVGPALLLRPTLAMAFRAHSLAAVMLI